MSLTYENQLHKLQVESQEWRERNFPPEHRTAPLQALGVCEEAGELAHAVLKMTQGIRGPEAMHLSDAADAMGDIVIYLCGLASSLGIALDEAVQTAWDEVKDRNWTNNPQTGVDDPDQELLPSEVEDLPDEPLGEL